jgi:hypothetical protein
MSNGIGKNPLNDISKVYLESIANQQEGYKPIDKKKETAMYRRAGNLARTSLSSKGKEKEDAQEKSGKIVSAITKQKEDERFERIGKDPKHQNNYKEALDPVGREDADVDNDGKKNTKSDKYLLKRRAAISKALASTKNGVRKEQTEIAEIHSQAHTPHEIPSGDLKKLVKKAVKRIDTDVDGDTDKNDKAKGELGEFIPGVGNKRLYSTTGTKTAKESFSNWRGDLTEIMTDDIDSKPIKEKKVNNKIKINPKLGEAIEELGGTLIEMVEVSEENLSERGDYWHPDPEKDRKLGGPGANQRAREDRAGASSPKKDYSKTTKPGESYMQFAKRRQAEKAAAAKLRREDLEIDEAVKGQDTESRKAASVERKAGDKRLSPSAGKANADKMERDIKFYDKVTKKTKPSVVGMTHEENEIEEGMSLKDFKANRTKLKRRESSADAKKRGHVGKEWYNSGRKYSPDEAKRSRANMDDEERRTRHRSAVDPDNEDDNNYSADKTKNPKKLRKQKAMGEETLHEKALSKAQQRFFGMVRATQKGEMENPSPEVAKAASSMSKSDVKDFAKTKHKGLPQKKEVKEGATEAPMSPQELALQKRKTQIDQMIARKRQQSLQKANKPANKPVNEASEDRLRDQRMERGGVDGNTNYRRPPAKKLSNAELGIKPGKTAVQKAMEKKGKSALDIVKSEIRAKHGKGAIMGDN